MLSLYLSLSAFALSFASLIFLFLSSAALSASSWRFLASVFSVTVILACASLIFSLLSSIAFIAVLYISS